MKLPIPKERDQLVDLGVNGSILLKEVLEGAD
jgi:hypothetical protein